MIYALILLLSFGVYSDAYMAKRWHKLCQGAGRYQAMSEAYAAHKPDPCARPKAKEWIR